MFGTLMRLGVTVSAVSAQVLVDSFYDDVEPLTEKESLLLSSIEFDVRAYLSSLGAKRVLPAALCLAEMAWQVSVALTCPPQAKRWFVGGVRQHYPSTPYPPPPLTAL